MTIPDVPRIPLGRWIENGIDTLQTYLSGATRAISDGVENAVDFITEFLVFYPIPMTIALLAGLAWWISRRWQLAVGTALGLLLLWSMRLWEPTMQTLALVLLATAVSIVLGVPVGVLAALSRSANVVIMPILDFMQTLPAFVYLIPAIPFFGLGSTSAIISTVIFAMPPAIRLTALGIQQVPSDLVEAADAFGSTPHQKLMKVQLPLALGSIRAGVNQTIMLSLSMVVIAAMIGAKGLGAEVWKAIQRVDVGLGFEAGIGIVILAMTLDRIMRMGQQKRQTNE